MKFRIGFSCSLFLSLLALAGCGTSRSDRGPDPVVAATKAPLILDVRTPEEYQAEHIPGALNLPVDQIGTRIQQIATDKTTPLYVHCQSGGRSARAKVTLEKLGFTNVRDLGSFQNAKQVLAK